MIDLKETLRLHGMWRRGESGGVRANLTGAVLTGADLTRANLTGAVLTRAVLTDAVLTGADLTRADLTGADLTGAVLTRAVLTDAVLTGADLTRADLTGADLTDADLTGAVLTGGIRELVTVHGLHGKILASITGTGTLEMGSWHLNNATCGTQHCRAGWAIHHAGPAGAMLEAVMGPAAAGAIIIAASCPYLDRVPDFYATNKEARADIERCAAIEAAAQ